MPGEASDGRFALIEFLFPRHASPPLHTHPQDESYIVQEGRLTVQAGEQRFELVPGAAAVVPMGVAHTFRVDSDAARARPEYAGGTRATGARRLGTSADADTAARRDTETLG